MGIKQILKKLDSDCNVEQAYPLLIKLYSFKVRSPNFVVYASKYGYTQWVDLILKSDYIADIKKENALEEAFRGGYIRIAELLLNSGTNPRYILFPAVQTNRIEIIQLLISRGIRFSSSNIETVARRGTLETFKLVLKYKSDPDLFKALVEAIKENNHDVIRYLDSLGVKLPQNYFIRYSDHVDIWTIKLLIELGYDPKHVIQGLGNHSPKLWEVINDLMETT